jgi:GDP-fucose protein O-fucosyltransferase
MIIRLRLNTLVVFVLLLFCLVTLRRLYLDGSELNSPTYGYFSSPWEESQDEFINMSMQVEFAEGLASYPISRLCETRERREGLVFTCDHINGGIGNIRNHILNCVRYAIEGGGALVVPSIAKRNASGISNINTKDMEGMGYLFDRNTFITRLSRSCPELHLLEQLEDFDSFSNLQKTLTLVPRSLEDKPLKRTGLRRPGAWRDSFDKWLAKNQPVVNAESGVHVKLGGAYYEYPIYHDGVEFAKNFGKILSFQETARYLAGAALWELRNRYELPIYSNVLVSEDAYFGSHIQVENDAVEALPAHDWPLQRFEAQAKAQVEEIKRTNLTVVYVACGDVVVAERFASLAKSALAPSRNMTVVTKNDLFRGKDLKLLESMTFDQQALVDFLVLVKATRFAGIGHSSFAWNVALRRHELSILGRKMKEQGDRKLLNDEYSVLLGYETQTEVLAYNHTMWA